MNNRGTDILKLEKRIKILEEELDLDCKSLEERIEILEKQINCKTLEKRIQIMENELRHIKSAIQYQIKKKNNKV